MEQTEVAAPQFEEALKRRKELPLWIGVWGRVYKEKPLAALGLTIVAVFLFIAIFADAVAPEELMGLDNLGRDVLTRVIYGARVSMFVGVGTVLLGTSLATILGMASAWFGGKIDTFIQRIVDGLMVFPWLVTLIVIVTILPEKPPIEILDIASWGTLKVILALALLDIAWVSRVIRSAVMAVRENQYVEAARALGASGWRINYHYILPNIMAPIITIATLNMGFAILSESVLSFLGHGVPPPNPSWGGMITGIGQSYLHQAPWLAIFPGLVLALVIFGINVLGDGLRDLLDPRLKGDNGGHFGV
jgi:peptide/nickel transport system permease protein